MKLKTQVVLVVVGLAAMVLPFFFMSGWLKYLVMSAGGLALNVVWGLYAGTPVSDEGKREGFRGFDETNYGDVTQNWRGMNCHFERNDE